MYTYGLSKSKYIVTNLPYTRRSLIGSYIFNGGKVTARGEISLREKNISKPTYLAVGDFNEKETEGLYSHTKNIRIKGDGTKVIICQSKEPGTGFFRFKDPLFIKRSIDGYLNLDLVGEEITFFPGSGHLILSVGDDTNLSFEGELDVTFQDSIILNNLSCTVKSSVLRAESMNVADELAVNMDLSNLQLRFLHTPELYITATRSSIRLDGHTMYPQIMVDSNSDITIFNCHTGYTIKIGKAEFEVTQNHVKIEKGKIISSKKKDGE